ETFRILLLSGQATRIFLMICPNLPDREKLSAYYADFGRSRETFIIFFDDVDAISVADGAETVGDDDAGDLEAIAHYLKYKHKYEDG
ncbi:MAG: hypothetical protein AAGH90_13495, partial [Pseudomonadota bacterium]